ncbi:MAG: ABC transporter ATP-binding protein [Planctomycetes bacterium]|nr:ABC transporter ATP-binding protein [Planctomycetota bacterium]
MFRIQDLAKIYTRRGQQVVAFETPSLDIPPGQYVALVGPSGSGKTTLLSILGGMLSPTRGQILLDGVSLYEQTPAERARLRGITIGFVFQAFNLVPYLTALENVQIPLYLAGVNKQKQREQAAELLGHLGLADRLHHKPCELSAGQQQRVALARTVANNPPVILADEPTGNLDPDSRTHVLNFLDDLHGRGRTIVVVTHDPSAAQRAQRQLKLRDGAIIEELTAAKVSRAA